MSRSCPICETSLVGYCNGECYSLDPVCMPGTIYATPTQETHTMPDTNPKAARAKLDGKLRLELIETALTHPLARVMAHGAEKYGVRNWRTQPIYLRTYVGALRRHTDAIANGEWIDPDSGQPHAAHVAACCQVILDADEHGTLTRDHDFAEAGVPGGVAAEARATTLRVDCGGLVLTAYMMRDWPYGTQFLNYTVEPFVIEARCCLGDGEPITGYCGRHCKFEGPQVAS